MELLKGTEFGFRPAKYFGVLSPLGEELT